MGNRKASLTKIFRKSSSSSSSAKSSATASSSASNGAIMSPLSPQPSSIEAKAAPPQAQPLQSQSPPMANGTSGASTALPSKDAKPDRPSTVTTRARQGSLSDRGAAVLRALARAPEDESPDGTPSGSLTPKLVSASSSRDIDAVSASTSEGYAPEATAETSPRSDSSLLPASQGLTEAEKESGRANREGLRRRGESKQTQGAQGIVRRKGSLDSGKKKSKSWEIPRKIFHSSIGFLVLYLYLTFQDLSSIVRGLSIFLAIVITADVIRLNNAGFEKFYESVLGFLMREAEKEKVNGVVWYLIGVIFSLHFFPADIACVSIMILSWADTCASTFGRLFGKYTPPLPSPPFAARKSLSGFIAALIAAALTAFLFWGTSIAARGERFDGISWNPQHAVLGATAPGPFHSGWAGWDWGFRGRLPPTTGAHKGALDAALGAASRTASGVLSSAGVGSAASASAPGMPLPFLCIGAGVVAAVAEGLELGGVDDNLSLPILSGFGLWAWLFTWGKLASLWAASAHA